MPGGPRRGLFGRHARTYRRGVAHFDISPEKHGDATVVVVRYSGEADATSIGNLIREIAALDTGATQMRILMDESELRPGLILPADIKAIVDEWRILIASKTIRIAVFATNPLVYGLNRIAETLAAGAAKDRLEVFRDRVAALDWLLRI